MHKTSIEKEISSAFAGVSLGNGIGLWQAQAIDDYETAEVQTDYRQKNEKEDWRLLKPDDLQRCHSSLSFFDADGMRFHIPAFLIGSLHKEVDEPIFHLTQLDHYSLSKWTTLSNLQRKSIVLYLQWCLKDDHYAFEQPSIRRALQEYWQT